MILHVLLAILLLCSGVAFRASPVPLVLPQATKSQLVLQEDGLNVLRDITGLVSPVVVIGPYRTGKSFLLNQLLNVNCDQGFGVGHTRRTETKGIWLYGQPQDTVLPSGEALSVLYIDTEGFESTGKSNAYDDRIFAVAAILSSVLIYNLPETIRESDIAKLSFAVELAQGFYDKYGQGEAGSFEPGAMLWLIQHDFLQGVSANEMVQQALAPVANPGNDADIDGLNHIRSSLTMLAGNSTGYSLRQPHLDRTRLCELPDAELDATYVQQRDALRGVVTGLARPKVVGGRPLTGRQLADLLVKIVDLLNAQDIPHVATMIEAYNGQVSDKLVKQYTVKLSEVALPMEEAALEKLDAVLRGEAVQAFEKQMLGRKRGVDMQKELSQTLLREFAIRKMENSAASDLLCGQLENACEARLDELQNMTLPSIRKFETSFGSCEKAFHDRCRGPARAVDAERLQRAWVRAKSMFGKEYNNRLYSGLLFLCIVAIVVFRFLFKVQLCEVAGWTGFVLLQVAPHVYPGADGMFGSPVWKATVQVWELVMFFVFLFDGAWVLWLLLLLLLLLLRWRGWRPQWSAVWHWRRPTRTKNVASSKSGERDLAV